MKIALTACGAFGWLAVLEVMEILNLALTIAEAGP